MTRRSFTSGLLVFGSYCVARSSQFTVTELCGLAEKTATFSGGDDKPGAASDALLTAESWLWKLVDVAGIDRALIKVSGDLTQFAVAAVGWSEALQKYRLSLHTSDLEYLKTSYMSDWAIVSAVAHELGHIDSYMRLDVKELPGDKKSWELEADRFAGRLL